ncbi:30S ribosomal protein S8 [Candidatus Woesearchaeota archaeon]|nr:30S ribosomal protein S8 [Candidatus Woesearchaeota archaeon]MBW3017425.1 30S ribosomal protein S8 [Candidatus Woesearchaeota archaeon]
MVQKDIVADALAKISRYEDLGRSEVELKPVSKQLKEILKIMNEEGFVGTFQEIEDGKGNFLKLNLIGRVNNCGAIKPRFSVKLSEIQMKEERYLPAKGFGIIIISTPKGIMTHNKAAENKTGGSLLAFCY